MKRTMNSSEDSQGNDPSFEAEPLIVNVKQKAEVYISDKKRRAKKISDGYRLKKDSNWSYLYYSFFNTSHTNTISLNELEFRCNQLNQISTEKNLTRSENNQRSTTSLTNIKEVLTEYSNPRKTNLFHKFFIKKKQDSSIRLQRNFGSKTSLTRNLKLEKSETTSKFMSAIRDSISLAQGEEKHSTVAPSNSDMVNYNKTHSNLSKAKHSMLKDYDINDNQELIYTLTKQENIPTRPKAVARRKENPSFDIENINYIMKNKYSYQVELKKFEEIFNKKNKSNTLAIGEIKHLIDFKNAERFFMRNEGRPLLAKNHKGLEKANVLSRQTSRLYYEILNKLEDGEQIGL